MSRYLYRLMSQTGLKIPGATNATLAPSPQPSSITVAPPPTLSSAADLPEVESESTASSLPPAASAQETPQQSLADVGQTGPKLPAEDPIAAESRLKTALADRDSQEAKPSLPTEMQTRAPTVATTPPPVVSSSATPPASKVAAPAPTSSAIVQQVMAWVAGGSRATERPTSTEARASGVATQSTPVPDQVVAAVASEPAGSEVESAPQIGSPASRMSIPESAVRRRSTTSPSPAAEPQDNSWSVHIGAIHLTLEVPPDKPAPQPPQLRPASSTHASATRFSGSRLSRYYLRPS